MNRIKKTLFAFIYIDTHLLMLIKSGLSICNVEAQSMQIRQVGTTTLTKAICNEGDKQYGVVLKHRSFCLEPVNIAQTRGKFTLQLFQTISLSDTFEAVWYIDTTFLVRSPAVLLHTANLFEHNYFYVGSRIWAVDSTGVRFQCQNVSTDCCPGSDTCIILTKVWEIFRPNNCTNT